MPFVSVPSMRPYSSVPSPSPPALRSEDQEDIRKYLALQQDYNHYFSLPSPTLDEYRAGVPVHHPTKPPNAAEVVEIHCDHSLSNFVRAYPLSSVLGVGLGFAFLGFGLGYMGRSRRFPLKNPFGLGYFSTVRAHKALHNSAVGKAGMASLAKYGSPNKGLSSTAGASVRTGLLFYGVKTFFTSILTKLGFARSADPSGVSVPKSAGPLHVPQPPQGYALPSALAVPGAATDIAVSQSIKAKVAVTTSTSAPVLPKPALPTTASTQPSRPLQFTAVRSEHTVVPTGSKSIRELYHLHPDAPWNTIFQSTNQTTFAGYARRGVSIRHGIQHDAKTVPRITADASWSCKTLGPIELHGSGHFQWTRVLLTRVGRVGTALKSVRQQFAKGGRPENGEKARFDVFEEDWTVDIPCALIQGKWNDRQLFFKLHDQIWTTKEKYQRDDTNLFEVQKIVEEMDLPIELRNRLAEAKDLPKPPPEALPAWNIQYPIQYPIASIDDINFMTIFDIPPAAPGTKVDRCHMVSWDQYTPEQWAATTAVHISGEPSQDYLAEAGNWPNWIIEFPEWSEEEVLEDIREVRVRLTELDSGVMKVVNHANHLKTYEVERPPSRKVYEFNTCISWDERAETDRVHIGVYTFEWTETDRGKALVNRQIDWDMLYM